MITLKEFLDNYPHVDEREIKDEIRNRIGIYGFEGNMIYVIKHLTDNILKYEEYHNVETPKSFMQMKLDPNVKELPDDIDRGEAEPDVAEYIYL